MQIEEYAIMSYTLFSSGSNKLSCSQEPLHLVFILVDCGLNEALKCSKILILCQRNNLKHIKCSISNSAC